MHLIPLLQHQPQTTTLQKALRLLLGAFLLFAGIAHLTTARSEFLAQVPQWVPLDADLVVVLSGVTEILLGAALLFGRRYQVLIGLVTAGFFIVIFPGNIAQYLNGSDAFGLNTDRARAIRLLFQPLLVWWALWSAGTWQTWRRRRQLSAPPTVERR